MPYKVGSEAPGQPSKLSLVDVGFLGEDNKIFKGFNLFKEFKISIFRFMQINLVKGSKKITHLSWLGIRYKQGRKRRLFRF